MNDSNKIQSVKTMNMHEILIKSEKEREIESKYF